MDIDEIAKLIAENLPSPYAMDIPYRETPAGVVFDLSVANEDSAEQWRSMARKVRDALCVAKAGA